MIPIILMSLGFLCCLICLILTINFRRRNSVCWFPVICQILTTIISLGGLIGAVVFNGESQ